MSWLRDGKRLAARNHWRGRRLQSRKSGGRLDRRGADGKGVFGISRKPKRAVLGSAPCRVEWGNTSERSQHTRQGDQMRKNDTHTSSDGNRKGSRDQAGITEHTDGASGWSGDGTLSATVGECGCGVSTGD